MNNLRNAPNFARAKALCGKHLPWCQDDPELLGQVVQNFIYDQESYRRKWAMRWFENFQFIFGNSNLRWSRQYDFAVDADFLNRTSAHAQRASTNISWVVAEALASMLYSNLPDWLVETADEAFQKGKRFAKIYEKILDCYMQRLCCDKEFAAASLILVAFANVAARVDWKQKAGKVIEFPVWRKRPGAPVFTDFMAPNEFTQGLLEIATPALDSMGQAIFEDRWEPVQDSSGKQAIRRVNTGDVGLSILTPFEYMRQMGSGGMHHTKYVDQIRLMDYDDWLHEFSEMEGKTRYYDRFAGLARDEKLYSFALRHFMQLMYTTPPSLQRGEVSGRTEAMLRGSLFRHKVVVVEHWDRPNDEMWPEGRRVVVTNGKCTHITPPQYRTNKLDGWHPYVEAQWMPLRPSAISAGPMDTVTAKNRELNLFDSLIATAGRRTMGSKLMYKLNAGIDPNKWTGEPGEAIPCTDMAAAKWLNDEHPIPPVVSNLREQIKEDVYEGSGAGDALRGERSKSVSSGYAIRQLQEREEKRLTPPRKAIQYFVVGIGEKITACLKQNAITLGDEVVGYLRRTAAGEFQTDDIVAFLTTPVDYGVDISIKEDSMMNKSKATKQADLLELIKNPVIQRRLENAEVLDTLLEYFDAEKLRDASSAHRDRAKRENEIFADFARLGPQATGLRTPVVIFEDDDDIHLAIHAEHFIRNSEEILANERYLKAFLLHEEQHRLQRQEKTGELMPGTSVQLPGMYAQVQQGQRPPAPPQIQFSAQQRQIQQQQQGAAGRQAPGRPTGERKTAQAPTAPAPAGSKGPPQISTSAPSQNTPTATTGRAA